MKKIALVLLVVFQIHSVFSQFFPEMISIQGGTFQMGLTKQESEYRDEQPVHEVFVSHFQMSLTPVTVAQYRHYCEAEDKSMPATPSWGWIETHPIVNVNWFEAVAYTEWLTKLTGQNYRLPTEAEWEFAAMGGSKTNKSNTNFADSLDVYAWIHANSGRSTQPVGQKRPNELGLYDMLGNVWELCTDWYDLNYYEKSQKYNPKGPNDGVLKVCRGGGWNNTICRIKDRSKIPALYGMKDIGFRVVLSAE